MEPVVSLAVISERLRFLPDVLDRILQQSLEPSRVYVWISEEPFLLDEGVTLDDLPPSVIERAEDGTTPLEVRQVENIGPHRKLLPLLREVYHDPDPPLIATADDDVLYPSTWLETMVSAYRRSDCAVTFRARRIRTAGARLAPYETWPLVPEGQEVISYRLFSTGRDGLLIHPHFLHEDALGDAFRELCPSRSDAWINASLLAGRTPQLKLSTARVLPDETLPPAGRDGRFPELLDVEPSSTAPNTLHTHNRDVNDEYLSRTFEHFGVRSLLTADGRERNGRPGPV